MYVFDPSEEDVNNRLEHRRRLRRAGNAWPPRVTPRRRKRPTFNPHFYLLFYVLGAAACWLLLRYIF